MILMIDLENLSEMELDVLKELGNIGAGHAATALSKLLGKEVNIAVPEVRLGEIKNLSNEFINDIVAGVVIALQDLEENKSGYLYIMFPEASSRTNCKLICLVWRRLMRKCMNPQLWKWETSYLLLFVMHRLILWI